MTGSTATPTTTMYLEACDQRPTYIPSPPSQNYAFPITYLDGVSLPEDGSSYWISDNFTYWERQILHLEIRDGTALHMRFMDYSTTPVHVNIKEDNSGTLLRVKPSIRNGSGIYLPAGFYTVKQQDRITERDNTALKSGMKTPM